MERSQPQTLIHSGPMNRVLSTKLVSVLAVIVLSTGIGACANDNRHGASRTTGHSGYFEGDDDSDDYPHSHKDPDDIHIRFYGHEAGAREKEAVSSLVKRYYLAGAVGDGARACSLIDPEIAKLTDFADHVPAVYASLAGSALFHNRTCSEVESSLFEIDHRILATGADTVIVTSLRIRGDHGIALLAFKTMPERQIAVHREPNGNWTIDALLDSEIV